MTDISIILCCYNSVERLEPTLMHLAALCLPQDVNCELVFVDNASTDGTLQYAHNLWQQIGTYPMHELRCPTQGLYYARQAGLKRAKGEYVIYCDDDNWLQKDYIQYMLEDFNTYPNVAAVGGQGIGVTDGLFPLWWETECGNYAVGKQLDSTGIANERGFLYGAGICLKHSALQGGVFAEEYPFEMVGRRAGKILSGDDGEICKRLRLLGYDLYYDERLVYEHYMPQARLTNDYLNKLLDSFDATNDIQQEYEAALEFGILHKNRYKELVRRLAGVVKYKFTKRKADRLRLCLAYAFNIRQLAHYPTIYDFSRFAARERKRCKRYPSYCFLTPSTTTSTG